MPGDLVDLYRAAISIGKPPSLKPGQGKVPEGLEGVLRRASK